MELRHLSRVPYWWYHPCSPSALAKRGRAPTELGAHSRCLFPPRPQHSNGKELPSPHQNLPTCLNSEPVYENARNALSSRALRLEGPTHRSVWSSLDPSIQYFSLTSSSVSRSSASLQVKERLRYALKLVPRPSCRTLSV